MRSRFCPCAPWVPERQTHGYVRHGVTNLYAALNVVSGKVIAALADRHCQTEYIEFLDLVDRRTHKKKVLHFIASNASTHASWLNLVERSFAETRTKRIRRESWGSLRELKRAIMDHVHHWNAPGSRFVWAKTSEQILRRVQKAAQDYV